MLVYGVNHRSGIELHRTVYGQLADMSTRRQTDRQLNCRIINHGVHADVELELQPRDRRLW